MQDDIPYYTAGLGSNDIPYVPVSIYEWYRLWNEEKKKERDEELKVYVFFDDDDDDDDDNETKKQFLQKMHCST